MSQLKVDTNMQNRVFSRVPTIGHPRNTFPLIKAGRTTHQFDILHPIWWKQMLPGDTIDFTMEFFSRLQTQATDLFDNLYTDIHVWDNPNRLVQTDWSRYYYNTQITGPAQDNSGLTSPNVIPKLIEGTPDSYIFEEKSFYDDSDYPTKTDMAGGTGNVSGVPHICNYKARHYHNIWNHAYRDQNLQNAAHMDYDQGPDAYANYAQLLPRNKRHDMVTSCLPFMQKGPAPTVPLVGTAPVVSDNGPMTMRNINNLTAEGDVYQSAGVGIQLNPTQTSDEGLKWGTMTGLEVQFSQAFAGFFVNDMRYTVAVQHFLEADARGGTRDVESLANIWQVQVEDFRVDRPQYLGGCTYEFDQHVVPQTSETDATPQANLASFSQQRGELRIVHSFVEPSFLCILASHRSNQTYQNVLHKEDTYRTRFDWYNPFFANLGEVPVKRREVWMSGIGSDDNAIFGFQRYGYELVYDPNTVTREMRSNATLSLDSKHMAYDFSTSPTLSDGFIKSFTPIERNIVVSPEVVDPIQINFMIKGKITRHVPLDSVPGLLRL